MDEKIIVPILINGTEKDSAVIQLWDEEEHDNSKVKIAFIFKDTIIEKIAITYWEALRETRSILEEQNILLICYGASINVFPSRMQLDMGYGVWAYKLTLGQPAKKKDIVWLFDTGVDVIPSTIETQYEYYQNWWNSIS